MSKIRGDQIQNETITSTQIKDGTVSGTDILDGTITGTDIANTTIQDVDIANATISWSKINISTYCKKYGFQRTTPTTNNGYVEVGYISNAGAIVRISLSTTTGNGVFLQAKHYIFPVSNTVSNNIWFRIYPTWQNVGTGGWNIELDGKWDNSASRFYMRLRTTGAGSAINNAINVYMEIDGSYSLTEQTGTGTTTAPTGILPFSYMNFPILEPVAAIANLPPNANKRGDIRLVHNEYAFFIWDSEDTYLYSWCLNKDSASGAGSASLILCDNNNTTDMHGLSAGGKYRIKVKMYSPAGSNSSNYILRVYQYYNSTWANTAVSLNLNSFDLWQEFDTTFSISPLATGIELYLIIGTSEPVNSKLYVDNLKITYLERDLVQYGDCESTTTPSLDGTYSNLTNATWDRSSAQKYSGTYSWALTLTDTSGSVDLATYNTSDMNGLVAGKKYKVNFYAYTTATTAANVTLQFREYVNSSWVTSKSIPLTALNSWHNITGDFTPDIDAVAAYLRLSIDSESSGKICYLDDFKIIETIADNVNLIEYGNCADTNAPTLDGGTSNSANATFSRVADIYYAKWNRMDDEGDRDADNVWHSFDGTEEPVLNNRWTNSSSPARYRKDGAGTVFLMGMINSGQPSTTLPAFTLPYGYRPVGDTSIPIITVNSSYTYLVGVCEIKSNGDVFLHSGAANGAVIWYSLWGVNFVSTL